MNEPKILVTGAPGGTQGSTAGKLVRLLREAHVPVRAFVHHTGSRSEALAQVGAEVHAHRKSIGNISRDHAKRPQSSPEVYRSIRAHLEKLA
jgi:hypothetical protein